MQIILWAVMFYIVLILGVVGFIKGIASRDNRD